MAPSCKDTSRIVVIRIVNVIVGIVGCGMLAYGVYLSVKEQKAKHILSSVTLVVGAITTFLSLAMATCGFKSVCFINFFLFVDFFMVVAEAAIAGFFISPSARAKLEKAIDPPEDLKEFIQKNAMNAGYVVVTVLVLELIGLILVLLQKRALANFESDDDEPLYHDVEFQDGQAGTRDRFGSKRVSWLKSAHQSDPVPDRAPAKVSMRDLSLQGQAAERNRAKNEALLKKYGI